MISGRSNAKLSGRYLRIVGALLLLAVGIGCTGAPPDIIQTRHRARYVDDRELDAQYEQLELYVLARDADGFDDLAALYLSHEESELSWELSSSSWSSVSIGDERWIGSGGFTAPQHGTLPRGQYRVIVEDTAGDRAETTVTLTAPEFDADRYQGPTLSVGEDDVVVESSLQSNRIELRDARGTLVRALEVQPGPVSAARLAGAASEDNESISMPRLVDLYVLGRGPEGVLYLSGPYRL